MLEEEKNELANEEETAAGTQDEQPDEELLPEPDNDTDPVEEPKPEAAPEYEPVPDGAIKPYVEDKEVSFFDMPVKMWQAMLMSFVAAFALFSVAFAILNSNIKNLAEALKQSNERVTELENTVKDMQAPFSFGDIDDWGGMLFGDPSEENGTFEETDEKYPVLGVAVEETEEGVLITSFSEKGNAERDGLRIGDIILSLDGEKAADIESIHTYLDTKKAGDKVSVEVSRNGETVKTDVELVEGARGKTYTFKFEEKLGKSDEVPDLPISEESHKAKGDAY